MKKIYFFLCLFLFMIVGCKNTHKQSPDSPETILINVDKVSDITFAEMFSKMEIIPLETNRETLISSVFIKFDYNKKNNSYLVFDKSQKIAFCFDENGQLKSSSAHLIGNGPGEYSTGIDFSYNPFETTYEILEYFGPIYQYDERWNFIRIKNKNRANMYIYTSPWQLIPLSTDMYALYHENVTPGENEGKDFLSFYSSREDTIKKIINLQRFIYMNSNYKSFTRTKNKTYFLPSTFSNTLYCIDLETLSLIPAINVDYGNRNMPEDILKNFHNTMETVRDIIENGIREYALTYNILQNDNLYFVWSRYNTNFYLTFYDKNTKKTVTTSDKFTNGGKMANLFLLSDTVWYGYVDASDMDSYIVLEYLTEESKQKLSQIKEDDNPVIVKYYLKNKNRHP